MSRMNFERARLNMVESQIRTWEVLDQRVLDVIAATPREHFVPRPYRNLAFADTGIPLGHGQVMMSPKLEGRLLQALDIRPTDTVLEIGTGSAYLTALLARLGRRVSSVEIIPDFTLQADKKLAELGVRNVTLETGDAALGWDKHAPYDVIAVTGSLPVLPPSVPDLLTAGGRLFAVVGESPAMEAALITREGMREWLRESLFETDLPPLVNAPRPKRFAL
jgi:protein-L-isoaspartate(D-aspartate) O-methyltransferase